MVVKGERKWRMCIHYSQMINMSTQEDTYPPLQIDGIVNNLAWYQYVSCYGCHKAYHQVRIAKAGRKYTAYEVNGKLYQFKGMPMGLTNVVAVFQWMMMKLVDEEGLVDMLLYFDDATLARGMKAEHGRNVATLSANRENRHKVQWTFLYHLEYTRWTGGRFSSRKPCVCMCVTSKRTNARQGLSWIPRNNADTAFSIGCE